MISQQARLVLLLPHIYVLSHYMMLRPPATPAEAIANELLYSVYVVGAVV